MKEKIIKLLVGIESIVYLIFMVLIVAIAFQNKYISVNNLAGLVFWGGLGILCPLLASIVANVFIRREKKPFGKIISYILIPYVAVSCISLFFMEFGGIFCSHTDNVSDFRKYDVEVEKMLRGYDNVLPEKEGTGFCIEEYMYKYVSTFDKDCDIYIKVKYEDEQQLKKILNTFEEKLAMNVKNETDNSGTYKYGECTINYSISQKQIEYILKLREGTENATAKCETDMYTVSISEQWDIETPYDDCKKFMVEGNEAAYIETFRDCTYCTSAESIAMNIFGEHSSLRDVEEIVLGDWTRYKMVIDYELSASQEIQGENPPEEETHYIYTNKKDMFIDVYANNQLLTEEEIQKFVESFKLK